jgi:hypothetical protein
MLGHRQRCSVLHLERGAFAIIFAVMSLLLRSAPLMLLFAGAPLMFLFAVAVAHC